MFTKLGDKQLENQISRDLDKIRSIVQKYINPEKTGLHLVGGYGRGEGGACLQGGTVWKAKNNYDLLLVTESTYEKFKLDQKISTLKNSLETELSFDVSISVKKNNQLREDGGQFEYDVIHGSHRLLGKTLDSDLAAPAQPSIAKSEFAVTLRNRSVLYLFSLSGSISETRKCTLISKFILGMLDAICIKEGVYSTQLSNKEQLLKTHAFIQYFNNESDLSHFRKAVHSALAYRYYSTDSAWLLEQQDSLPVLLAPTVLKLFSLKQENNHSEHIKQTIKSHYQYSSKRALNYRLQWLRKVLSSRQKYFKVVSETALSVDIVIHTFFLDQPERHEQICSNYAWLIE